MRAMMRESVRTATLSIASEKLSSRETGVSVPETKVMPSRMTLPVRPEMGMRAPCLRRWSLSGEENQRAAPSHPSISGTRVSTEVQAMFCQTSSFAAMSASSLHISAHSRSLECSRTLIWVSDTEAAMHPTYPRTIATSSSVKFPPYARSDKGAPGSARFFS